MAVETADLHSPSTTLSEWLVVILIVVSLAMEAILHRVERWVASRHLHLQAVLRNLYRELMVLGSVSFVFIFYEATAHPSGETVASFEFAHVFIFLLAIVHTVVIMASVGASLSLSRRWRDMEQMELLKYLELKEEFRLLKEKCLARRDFVWQTFLWWLPDPRRMYRYWRIHEIMTFHDIRFQFLYYRDLPEDFNFSGYLRKIKAVIFIDLVQAHWSLWLLFLLIVLCDIFRRKLWQNDYFEYAFAIAASVFLMVVAGSLTFKIRRVYWELTKHPATYFDNVTKEAVQAELQENLQIGPCSIRMSTPNPSARVSLDLSVVPVQKREQVDNSASGADDERSDNDMKRRIAQLGAQIDTKTPNAFPFGNYRRSLDLPDGRISVASTPATEVDGTKAAVANVSPPALSSAQSIMLGDGTRRSQESHRTPSPLFHDAGRANDADINRGKRGKSKGKRAKPAAPAAPTPDELQQVAMLHSPEEPSRRRASLEGRPAMSIISPNPSPPTSGAPSRRASLDNGALSIPAGFRSSIDGLPRNRRASLELAAGLPVQELEARNRVTRANERDVAIDIRNLPPDKSSSSSRNSATGVAASSNSTNASNGAKDVDENGAVINASIMRHLQSTSNARVLSPPSKYPKIVTKLIPRLGRVASTVEKLFWFGSHRFFLWCVEFTLFMSTVLMASTAASFVLVLRKDDGNVRQMAIASVVTPAIALIYVLIRISYVMKKYAFVLNNAGLVPEVLALQVIHNIRQKRQLMTEMYADVHDDASASESGSDAMEAARERRRKLSRFFSSEAESGNMPGLIDEDIAVNNLNDVHPLRKMMQRQTRRRRRRVRAPPPKIPSVPQGSHHRRSAGDSSDSS